MIDRDPHQKFRYASLQSDAGQYLLSWYNINTEATDSVILIQDRKFVTRSTAALRVARQLRGPVRLLYAFIIIPAFLRDPVYDLVARKRYKWFGKREECRVPTPELKSLFIE